MPPLEVIILAPLIVVTAYVIFGLSGFGSTLVAVPLLAHLFPLTFVIPMMVVLDCIGSISMGFRLRADVNKPELKPMLPFMIVGMLAGVFLLLSLPAELLLGGLGVFVLARRLKDLAFTTLYASDLGRAHQTARCIADATGHEILADRGLRERSFGIFEGLTNAEIQARHPEESVLFAKRLPDYAMPGGESAAQFRERVVTTLEKIAGRHADETIVVVSHGLVLDAIYRTAVKMALDAPRGFPLLNCSVHTFRHGPEGWLSVAVCDVGHLAEAEVTHWGGIDTRAPKPSGAGV